VPFTYGAMLFLFSIILLFSRMKIYLNELVVFLEWEIISWNSTSVIITLLLDWIRLRFISVVLLISSIVLFYCYVYIAGDVNLNRFIILVFLFVLSMMFLILSPNIIRILLGWDGLGLVSYCLVIYYQNIKSARAGILTVLSNRVGDVAILLCISWIFNFGGWNFFYLQYLYSTYETSIIFVLVILAAITKSAQIPFSAWLPAAIAAPTPVSALVHSSTLVTAGVYLLIRFSTLIGVDLFLLYVSVFTIILSGVGANFEMDLKKIIALSTLRQLGVIIITLSLGLVELTFFHLVRHALFKSLLFLCAGAYIHSYGDIQDIRFLGGVNKAFPLTSLLFIGCSLSLCGFPFLSGFYSKDIILESFFIGRINNFLLVIIFLRTMATITYSIRLIYFMGFKNLGLLRVLSGRESWYILYPIIVLFIRSTLAGAGFRWIFLTPVVVILPLIFKLAVLVVGRFLGVLIFFSIREKLEFFIFDRKKLFNFFGIIWGLPIISTIFFIIPLSIGEKILKFMDHGWLEELGGQGIYTKMGFETTPILDNWNLLGVKSYFLIFFFIIAALAILAL